MNETGNQRSPGAPSYVVVPAQEDGAAVNLNEIADYLTRENSSVTVERHGDRDDPYMLTIENLSDDQAAALKERYGARIAVSANFTFAKPTPGTIPGPRDVR